MFDFARWLGSTPLSIGIQQHTWLVALLQMIHIAMIGLVFVSMLMITLRVLGRMRADEPLEAVWARFAPWIWGGFAAMVASGLLLLVGEPLRQVSALSFWLKMGLIVMGLAGLLWLRRHPTRAMAYTLIAVWTLIIFLGRAIAYDVEVWGSWHLGA